MNSTNEKLALKVENLSKNFLLPHQRVSSIKNLFINPFRGYDKETQQALRNIKFEVLKGEFFGIVGRNGSGKSTLLKCIAGIYKPDSGKIDINGSLVPFIELGVGFNSDLSGRDNVYLNGAMLGFSRQEIAAMYDDIVEFAELEKFMDQKLKNYSSGMQVRLAFSIAIRAESDILLLDEVLAVGDAAFQRKCYDYFASLKKRKKTIILVSHSMSAIERFCDRALLLEANEVKFIGKSTEVANMYDDMFLKEEALKKIGKDKNQPADEYEEFVKNIKVSAVQEGKKTKTVNAYQPFEISVELTPNEHVKKANVGINIKDSQNQLMFASETIKNIGPIELIKDKKTTITLSLMQNVFSNGRYNINVGIADRGTVANKSLAKKRDVASFTVFGVHEEEQGLIVVNSSIKVS